MIYNLSLIAIFLYVALFLLSVKDIKRSPILPIFLITFGFVLMSRVFIGVIFPDFDISLGTWIYWGAAPVEFVEKSIVLIDIFLVSTIFFVVKNSRAAVPPGVNRNNITYLTTFSVVCMALTAPVYIYRGWTVFNGISESGYLATFTGDVKAPLIVNIGVAIFQVSYYFFLASFPNRRKFYFVSVLFLIASISSLGTGQRSELVTSVLFVIFISYFYNYNVFSLKKLIPIGLVLIVLSIAINAIRFGDDPINAIYLGLIDFLWGQGITLFTLIGSLEHAKEFSTFEGFFFANKIISCDIAPYFTGEFCNNSLAVANVTGIWWQRLTYILDPIKFAEGGGLGGSVIPSLYLMFNLSDFYMSVLMLFISTYCFWKIVQIFQSAAYSSKLYVRVYSLFFLNAIIFIPRAGLDSLIPHPRLLLMALFIGFLYVIFKSAFHVVPPYGKRDVASVLK